MFTGFELAASDYRDNPLAERRQTILSYLGTLSEQEADFASGMADDLMLSGKPLAKTVVIIPVATQQESANIARTVELYDRQKPKDPFTVVLGLNSTELGYYGSNIATIDAVEKAKCDHPDLDLRSSLVTYDNPTIGMIRRDLWNAVGIASERSGSFKTDSEVIGINQDIDLWDMTRRYVAEVQQSYSWLDSRHIISPFTRMSATQTRHGFSAEHPNISKAVMLSDYTHRTSRNGFEAGTIVPFSWYAKAGGIDARDKTHEVIHLKKKPGQKLSMINGTANTTSPRRYISKMRYDGYDIWKPETFGADDNCRDENALFSDISDDLMKTIVLERIPALAHILKDYAVERAVNPYYEERFTSRHAGKNYASFRDHSLRQLSSIGSHAILMTDRIFESRVLTGAIYSEFSGKALTEFIEKFVAEESSLEVTPQN